MNDFYTEQLVKRQRKNDTFIKILLGALAAVSFVPLFLHSLGILVTMAIMAGVVIGFRQLDVEYEYLYINGELDIDKIIKKSRRKRRFSVHVNDMEMLAPVGHDSLKSFRAEKKLDFSSGTGAEGCYVLIAIKNGQMTEVIFEPNRAIVEGFSMAAPRKVIRQR